MDVARRIGKEEIASPGDLHQRDTLAGEGVADGPADTPGSERHELKVALVGDHRPGPGHHLAVHTDPAHLAALLLDSGARHLGMCRRDEVTVHGGDSLVLR